MSDRDDHAFWKDELAAYALDALEPHEAAALEGHLVGCDRCRAELGRLAPAVQELPASVAAIEPPPRLRRRILHAVEAEGAATRSALASPPPRRRLRREGARRAGPWRPAPLVGLGATLAIAFLAGFAVRGGDGPPGRTIPAQALTAAPVSAALVRESGAWQLRVERLPELSPKHVYEVWIRKGSGLRPSSLFVLSRDGRAQLVLSESLPRGAQVLVTREPAGGSATPTSPPLLRARA
jgi:anti-sigma-K factor RskA